MEYAKRMTRIKESTTFKYSALARKPGVIDLTIGRTNYDTPKAIKDATKKALDEGKVHYTPTKGIPELRERIAEKLIAVNGIEGIDKEKVLVSAGAKQLIFEAVLATVNEGDTVAIPDPSWVSYESIVEFAGGMVDWLPTYPEEGFIPGERFFSALENSMPKLIFLNSPNNPTGAVYPKKVIKRIADIAARKNAWLVSDEIYEELIYEGEHFSAGSIYDKCIVVNGYSKNLSMTGWRLGYAACRDKEIIDKMNMIQEQSVSCATSFAQYGAVAAYGKDAGKETATMREDLRKRRDYLIGRLEDLDVVCVKPSGAFYAFPSFKEDDDIKLADKLIENGVATVPGSPFGSKGKGCLRLSYGASKIEELEEAVKRIERTIQ